MYLNECAVGQGVNKENKALKKKGQNIKAEHHCGHLKKDNDATAILKTG